MGTVGFAENIPALAVVVGDLSCYQEYRDRHLIYIDASLAAMQFMLALEALGLASCPINWPDIESREQSMQKLLALPVYHRPVMLIAIGYAAPTALVAYSQKKELEQLVSD
jgi:nitroreductase